MTSDHRTRCAWIQQNDANAAHEPFMCGAAAAQMILYGRDVSKFKAGSTTLLADTPAQLRTDQERVWKAIIAESSTCPLPPGIHYDGNPVDEQICETAGPCWATFPAALALTITHGMSITAGPLAGVEVRVRALADDSTVLETIAESLDRGVAVALLFDGQHWVVVYRCRVVDEDHFEVYYRDGQRAKSSLTAWPNQTFFQALSAPQAGSFRDKYIMVTAAPRSPIVSPGGAVPRLPMNGKRTAAAPLRRDAVPFASDLERTLLADLVADEEWAAAFRGARLRQVTRVQSSTNWGSDYYLADFGTTDDTSGSWRRTGSAIVDAFDLKRRATTGVETSGQWLDRMVDRDVVDAEAARLRDFAGVRVDDDLFWMPCDQSPTPFLPFHVLRGARRDDPSARIGIAAYVRADGVMFPELTQRRAGV